MWNPSEQSHANEAQIRVFNQFIEQLLNTADVPQALVQLRTRVLAIDDPSYETFIGVLQLKWALEQQRIEQLQTQSQDDGFGQGFEADLARAMAGVQGAYDGQRQALQISQARLRGLEFIGEHAGRFRLERAQKSGPASSHSVDEEEEYSGDEDAYPVEAVDAPQRGPSVEGPRGSAASGESPAQRKVRELKERFARSLAEGADPASLMPLVSEIYEAEKEAGNIPAERQQFLGSVMEEAEDTFRNESDDLKGQVADVARVRRLAERLSGAALESRPPGASAPPVGSRSERLLELLNRVKDQIFKEKNRPQLGDEEQRALDGLVARAVGDKKAVYDAGADEEAAAALERESVRRLALDLRQYRLRTHLTLARPIWPSPPAQQDANAVFFSGSDEGEALAREACGARSLTLLSQAGRQSFGESRWTGLRACHVAVFDLRGFRREGMDEASSVRSAAACYETGIALALGRPVLVLTDASSELPFDVDILPVALKGDGSDAERVAHALDEIIYGQQRGGADTSVPETVEEARRLFGEHPRRVVKQLAGLLDEEAAADALHARAVLEQLLALAGPEAPQLITPSWPGSYPEANGRRCFHVMPFREKLDEAQRLAEGACRAQGVEYVRGDREIKRNIIRSIWDDICRATHVVVDLTGFNANVALELGMADTLGRRVLLVSEDLGALARFPALAKDRVHPYTLGKERGKTPLPELVGGFLQT